MIRFDRCTNITLEDVEVRYGAFWNIGFGDCERITIRALTMRNGIYEEDGPNTDGINLWDCKKVRVSDCVSSEALICTTSQWKSRAYATLASESREYSASCTFSGIL